MTTTQRIADSTPAMLDKAMIHPAILTANERDSSVRWSPGQRLHHLFESRCDVLVREGNNNHPALLMDDRVISYNELDRQANQLARYLLAMGFRTGDRLGLLFDKSTSGYIAQLATLKMGAAYVPLDVGFPAERIQYIIDDAELAAILSVSTLSAGNSVIGSSTNRASDASQCVTTGGRELSVPTIEIDTIRQLCDEQVPDRLSVDCLDTDDRVECADMSVDDTDALAYIIYTSGSTGWPKGVPILHSSICNFVAVAAECYGYRQQDRVYQGLSMAFDFAVEEFWVPLVMGSTLVPNTTGSQLLGDELRAFLFDRQISALCCVPTLLATIDGDLPDLRLLIVSGESCQQDIVQRWHCPNRTILNAYGPTETTVTATMARLEPGNSITIGQPLPTYTIVILDPEHDRLLQYGETGEIGIAGVGLSPGYLNRDELTQRVFIDDFIGLPDNPGGRIYRSGDLGCLTQEHQLTYLGRIDTQVKIRGYRIELSEIESAIMQQTGIAHAVVNTHESQPGSVELAAYYSVVDASIEFDPSWLQQQLRATLPAYMVPAYYMELDSIPMMTSGKADRKALPAPTQRLRLANTEYLAPEGELQIELAGILGELLQTDEVSRCDDFFNALGANSLMMARFCTRIREQLDISDVSMKNLYQNSSIEALAEHLEQGARYNEPVRRIDDNVIASNLSYYGCGVLQFVLMFSYSAVIVGLFMSCAQWAHLAETPLTLLGRSLTAGAVTLSSMIALPVIVKWILIGRWKAETFPVWSLRYLRFWFVKLLVRGNPAVLFAGTPLFPLYLRALGARIGRNTLIQSHRVPVCTDLLSIGDNAVVRKDAIYSGYRAESNRISTGSISIGENAYVGAGALLDPDTQLGANAELGHTSTLCSGQHIPDHTCAHGTPAVLTSTRYQTLPNGRPAQHRKIAFACVSLASGVIALKALMLVSGWALGLGDTVEGTSRTLGELTLDLAIGTGVFYFGGLLLGLMLMAGACRLLMLMLDPGKTYPLYGIHYHAFRLISRISNNKPLNNLFGDSSYAVGYLKWIGYKLGRVLQTGSNFGLDQGHDNPFLCHYGCGTMVSDGFSMLNAEVSNSSFRLNDTRVGDNCFLGNNIIYPSQAAVGNNCLLATKVMVPVDGPLRENVGLLGSPCFEIPRSNGKAVASVRHAGSVSSGHSDICSDTLTTNGENDKAAEPNLSAGENDVAARLNRKNRANLLTIGYYLLLHWGVIFIAVMAGVVFASLFDSNGVLVTTAVLYVWMAVTLSTGVLIDRLSLGFKRLEPQQCSIYDRYYWHHEQHWKLSTNAFLILLNGTPLKTLAYRLAGVRIGKKVFDDGCGIPEKTLVEIGDYCTLNELSVLQGHSLEDGLFKSDRIRVGKGCTIGPRAFVHYGTKLGDNSLVDTDAFLMKGQYVPPHSVWTGNPASEQQLTHRSADEPRFKGHSNRVQPNEVFSEHTIDTPADDSRLPEPA